MPWTLKTKCGDIQRLLSQEDRCFLQSGWCTVENEVWQHSQCSQHFPWPQRTAWQCNWASLQLPQGPRICRRTLIAKYTHFTSHPRTLVRLYVELWRLPLWIKRMSLMATLRNNNYKRNSKLENPHFEGSLCVRNTPTNTNTFIHGDPVKLKWILAPFGERKA